MLCDMFEYCICFNEVLGFKVVLFDLVVLVFSFVMCFELIGYYLYGCLYGGVIVVSFDIVVGFVVMVVIVEKFNSESVEQVVYCFGCVGIIDLWIDYLY